MPSCLRAFPPQTYRYARSPRAVATPKPWPNSTPHDRREAEHRLGEVGAELVEDRLTPARRDVHRHDAGRPADAVLLLADVLDELFHPRRGLGVGTPHIIRLDLLQRHRGYIIDGGDDVADLVHHAEYADAVGDVQELLGDGAGGDADAGLTGR